MKDPIRLRDAKSPHARAARDLLRNAVGGRASGSGFSVRGLAGPSLEQRDAMWASLAATIGPMPPGGGESGGGVGAGTGPDGATGADPASALSGGDGLVAGASASSATGVSAVKIASVASSAAQVASATAAAPAGKAALSLSAAKLWIVLGIGAAGSVGTAAYVTSPSRAPETTQAIVAPPAVGRAAPGEAKAQHGIAPDLSVAPAPLPEPKPGAPVADVDAVKSEAARPAPSAARAPTHDARAVVGSPEKAASQPAEAALPLTPAERASRLRDEAKATAVARIALRSGDAGGALRLLADAARDFGGGAMGQEREALTIEALARSGAREAASVRAASFLARFPDSTYAAAVRPFAATSIPK